MEIKNLRVNDSFIVNALRNCGYNNYSAISDIIDNSLEPEVDSTYVKIDFEIEGTGSDKASVKSIFIIDDGNGMSAETLEEAMALGSKTGKDGLNNLGMYGAGMKTASFSIGQKLEVFTKVVGGDVNYASISLEDAINNNIDGRINVNYGTYEIDSDIYKEFKERVGADHGTIVKISILDKLANKNYKSFKETLKNKVGENFNKFIYANDIKFYVCKDEVPYVDLMGDSSTNELMGEGSFDVCGHTIRYKAWYIPMTGGVNDAVEDESHFSSVNGNEYISRSIKNQGLYIYRQNRLVGKGLNLGLWGRDGWKNGFRCEIFMDGNCDSLFGGSFIKMIGDSNKDNISPQLREELAKAILPYANESTKRTKKESALLNEEDPNIKKQKDDFYKRITDKQNKNMMLKANRKGENKPKTDNDKEHKHRGPQENPNPIKERTNKWLDGFEERPMGRTAEMYGMERSNGKRIIVINTDHPFYQKFYSQLNTDLKFIMAQIISCEEIAKQNVNYYNAEEVQKTIDLYNIYQASEVSKSLMF